MPKRKDPEVKNVYRPSSWWDLLDRETDAKGNPLRHEVWAWQGHAQTGVDKYKALGYRVEEYKVGGVRPAGVTEEDVVKLQGQPIERGGHLLMTCPIEDKIAREQLGDDGNTGLAAAKRREELIRGKGLAREALGSLAQAAGPSGPYFGVKNETVTGQQLER